MPILNYTTKIDAKKTVGEIQDILASHGASKIMIDYENSVPIAITFQVNTNGQAAGKCLRRYGCDAL
jgi:hypothetical protein